MKKFLFIASLLLFVIISNAQITFQKTYGGTGDDRGYFVQQTTDGGFIITGYTSSFGAGMGDFYLIKTDINGDTLWTKTFGGTSLDGGGESVQQTAEGGYIIVGATLSFGTGNFDIYLIKTDTSGDILWTKTFGGINDDESFSVQQTNDGGYIICGNTESFGAGDYDTYLIKTDANGDSIWTKTFGGIFNDLSYSGRQTSDGGYIILGSTWGFGAGNRDIYLIKTDSLGNSLWSKTFGGTGTDTEGSIQQSTDGGYIITGFTNNFGAGGYADAYLIKTDSLGNSGCNQGNPATIVSIPSTQETNPTFTVTSPPTIVTAPATFVSSGGITTTLCTSVGIKEISPPYLFQISPNPSAGNIIISFDITIINGNVEILNILGENIFSVNIVNESKKEINLKNISDGIYFVKVFDGEKSYCKKLIVEHD